MKNNVNFKVTDLTNFLPITRQTNMDMEDRHVTGVYCGDLLSLVMSKAKKGDIWITIQSHINVVAVASLVDISAIIIVEGSEIELGVIEKAQEEGIAIFTTSSSAYEIASLCVRQGL